MLKKSLFVSIFVLLFIGLSDYGYGCHKIDPLTGEKVPHGRNAADGCEGPPDAPSSDVGEYIVMISGGIESDNISHWLGHQGEKVIVINRGRNLGSLPVFTDLSFFMDDAVVVGGGTCFFDSPFVEFLGQLGVLKGGGAVAQFWFDGFQKFLVDGQRIPARYYLTMFGQFTLGVPPARPPIGEGETFVMEMMDWELTVQGGKNIQAVSCMGEADASGGIRFDPLVVITVERCGSFTGCP